MIHFGTAGWRGIIGDEFTFRNVRLVSQAIAEYLLATGTDRPAIVGHDTRFLSEKFAAEAAKVLSHNRIRALCCTRDAPTPTIAFAVRNWDAAGALNFTASHNPPEYNGLKFHDTDGSAALPPVTEQIEARLRALEPDFADSYVSDDSLLQAIDPSGPYLASLSERIDLAAIAEAGLKVAVDSLFGTGREYLDRLLLDAGVGCKLIHNFRDPYFGGYSPEGRGSNLEELAALVRDNGCSLGLATDSDCDRFAIVDTGGVVLDANDVLGLLADYALASGHVQGDIGRTVGTSHLLDRVAAAHGVAVHETPVGFKYLGHLLGEGRIAFGGEESGGMSIAGHIPDKDGILACLLVTELAARRGIPLRAQLADLWSRVGRSFHARRDYTIPPGGIDGLDEALGQPPETLAGLGVREVNDLDGAKLILDDETWLLYRRSGTEEKVRCYAEAASEQQRDALLDAAAVHLFGDQLPGASDATD